MDNKIPTRYMVNDTEEIGDVVDLPYGEKRNASRRMEGKAGEGIKGEPFTLIALRLETGEVKLFDKEALTPVS